MGLFDIFKNKEEKVEETRMPSAEQIIKDAEELRKDPMNNESDIPDIICAYYSAMGNIELDSDYVRGIITKSKNDNTSN